MAEIFRPYTDMTLIQYLDITGQSRAQFAARIGVTRAAVAFWTAGLRTPHDTNMRAIVHATDGAVSPNDFMK